MEDYAEKRKLYMDDPERYLITKAETLKWFKPWNRVNNYESDPHDLRWFIGGCINLSYELLDRHVLEGHGHLPALIYKDPNEKTSTTITYEDLLDKASRMAGLLTECGVGQGDLVAVYMPSIPEAVIAMLATIRIGAVYNVMATVHPVAAMVERIEDFKPKIVMTTNYELGPNDDKFNPKKYLDDILGLSKHKPDHCIVLQRVYTEPAELIPERDLDWEKAMANSKPHGPVPIEINEPMLVIYTSGTTGKPKGVVLSVRKMAFNILLDEDLFVGCLAKDGENAVALTTSLYIWSGGQLGGLYAPLHRRLTLVLWERSVGDAKIEEFYRLLVKHQVSRLTIPTCTLRPLIGQDPDGQITAKYQPHLRINKMTIGAVPGDRTTFDWIEKHLKVQFGQLYGLTETGGITTVDISDGRRYSDQPAMSSGKISPGLTVKILREDGTEADVDEPGSIVLKLPVPTLMSNFHNDTTNRKLIDDYLTTFPGHVDLHDEGYFDSSGHMYVLNRSDSVFKIGGHRVSCDALEEVLLTHPKLAECVVVTKLKSPDAQVPIGFFTLIEGARTTVDEDLSVELQRRVADQLGDWIVFEDIIHVPAIPKTTTGKIARGTINAIVRHERSMDTEDPILKHFWDLASN